MNTFALWTLNYALNAAWQIPLVFATAWLVTRANRRSGPATQHRVWVSALLLEVLLPACPLRPAEVLRWLTSLLSNGSGSTRGAHVTVTMGVATPLAGLRVNHTWLAAVVLLYTAIALYFVARLGVGLYRTSALRRRSQLITLSGTAARSCDRYARIFAVSNASIATSAQIASPLTLGVRPRVLLLPAAFAELGADLDAALAHEFAHMRRYDYARNLVYQLLSLPIVFHPLLWLTLARISETREMVCDAMAAEAVAGREQYARSLLRLAALVSANSHSLAPQAIGILGTNHFANFERRIMNLTQTPTQLTRTTRLATTGLGIVLALACCTSALALRMQVAAPAQPDPAAQNANTLPQTIIVEVPRTSVPPAKTFAIQVDPATGNVARISHVTSPTYNIVVDHPAADPMQVAGSVIAGNILTRVMPIYPQSAKDAKIEGAVVLRAIIGKDGKIQSLKVVSGPRELYKPSLDAVKDWTYKPYLLNGEPTEVDTNITITYSLNR